MDVTGCLRCAHLICEQTVRRLAVGITICWLGLIGLDPALLISIGIIAINMIRVVVRARLPSWDRPTDEARWFSCFVVKGLDVERNVRNLSKTLEGFLKIGNQKTGWWMSWGYSQLLHTEDSLVWFSGMGPCTRGLFDCASHQCYPGVILRWYVVQCGAPKWYLRW